MKHWISAFRLRTLPLALSSILMGTLLAFAHGRGNYLVAGLCILTTVLLQVLSNLANDYGDSIHGADGVHRQGPQRAVQSGAITREQMRRAVFICAALAFLSGIWLLWEAFGQQGLYYFMGFVMLGLFAIWSAISYTAGNRPYGYAGLGDVFVLLFFGPVGVLGTYYLQAQTLAPYLWLPALSCGLLATGVLNVNNIRDIDSDRLAGKRTIPVRIGRAGAKIYHWCLLAGALLAAFFYILLKPETDVYGLMIISTVPALIRHGISVQKARTAAETDPLLKELAIIALMFSLAFGIFQLLPVLFR